MSGKFSDMAMRAFVVIYACACIWAAFHDCKEKDIKKEKSINTMISENIAQYKDIEFCWIEGLGNDDNADNVEGYECGDVHTLDAGQLAKIIDANNYIEKGENIALGYFRPVGLLKFKDEQGNRYSVVYSFMNAEVRFYLNGKIKKTMMMYNSDYISEILNSL